MIFPFLEHLKFSPTFEKKVTWPHHLTKITWLWECSDSVFPQQPLHQMLQFFLISTSFLIYFLLVILYNHEGLLNSGKLPNKAYNLNSDHLASGWLFCWLNMYVHYSSINRLLFITLNIFRHYQFWTLYKFGQWWLDLFIHILCKYP